MGTIGENRIEFETQYGGGVVIAIRLSRPKTPRTRGTLILKGRIYSAN